MHINIKGFRRTLKPGYRLIIEMGMFVPFLGVTPPGREESHSVVTLWPVSRLRTYQEYGINIHHESFDEYCL